MSRTSLVDACDETAVPAVLPAYIRDRRRAQRRGRKTVVAAAVGAFALLGPALLAPSASASPCDNSTAGTMQISTTGHNQCNVINANGSAKAQVLGGGLGQNNSATANSEGGSTSRATVHNGDRNSNGSTNPSSSGNTVSASAKDHSNATADATGIGNHATATAVGPGSDAQAQVNGTNSTATANATGGNKAAAAAVGNNANATADTAVAPHGKSTCASGLSVAATSNGSMCVRLGP